MLTHDHIWEAGPGYELDGMKVYIVKTPLVIDKDDPGYDASAYEDMMQAVTEHLRKHPHLGDSVRLVRV